MTIYLKGIDEQLQPAIQGFVGLARHLQNPDREYVAMVQKSLAEGRITQEELNNMSPEEFASKAGISLKSARKLTTGVKSAKRQSEDITAAEMQRIMTSGTPEERANFLANQVGTLRPGQSKIETATALTAEDEAYFSSLSRSELVKLMKNATPEQQKYFSAKLAKMPSEAEMATTDAQAKTYGAQARSVLSKEGEENEDRVTKMLLLKRLTDAGVGEEKNLYMAYRNKKVGPKELAAINRDEGLGKAYAQQRDDYWKETEDNLRRELQNSQDNPDTIFKRLDASSADRYHDLSNRSNAKDIFAVLRSKEMQDTYTNMKDGDVKPAERHLWEAAQAIKDAKGKIAKAEGDKDADRRLRIDNEFRLATQKIVDVLTNPMGLIRQQITEQDAQSLVDRYNREAAIKYGGGIVPQDQIPMIAFDKTGPNSDRNNARDKPTIKFLGMGTDPRFTKAVPSGEDSDPTVTQSIQFIDSKKGTLEEALADPDLTENQKKALRKHYKIPEKTPVKDK